MTTRSDSALACAVVCLLLACGGSEKPVAHPPPPGGGGGGGSGGNDGGGGGGSFAVAGKVVDGVGQPVASRTVLLGAQIATTDASGRFSFSGISSPYDLTIVATPPDKTAVVYHGLTRLDPTVWDLALPGSLPNTGHVQGTLFGGLTFEGSIVAVSWASPESVAGVYADSFPYDLGIRWSGASTITGTLHALQWTQDANGLPTGYQGIGVKNNVSLTAGSTVTTGDMNLEIPSTQTVSTTLSSSTGYTIARRTAQVTFSDGSFFPVAWDQSTATSYSVLVPAGSGVSTRISAIAVNAGGSAQIAGSLSGVAPGTSNGTLALPTPAVPATPAEGGTGVGTNTDFTWSALAGGVHVVYIVGPSSAFPAFAIVTAGTTSRIPDLSAQGLTLPATQLYHWSVIGLAPLASVDAVAATGAFVPTGSTTFQSVAEATFTTR